MNPLKQIRIEKVTLNFGAGKDQARLEKGVKLITSIAGKAPVKTRTQKRIQEWGLRPGLPIGCKLTLRNEEAVAVLKRLLEAKENALAESCFDNEGNVAFGIHEYIDIPDVKYDPEIGILGLQVTITLQRPGFRVKKRPIRSKALPRQHRIPQEEAIEFMQQTFKLKVGEEDDV